MARNRKSDDPLRGGVVHVSRSRGAAGGLTIALLGVWGTFIPFVGPYFDFAFTPDRAWAWTATRFWLEVLPGVVAVIGGLVMLLSTNRFTASLGAWLGVAAGAWFVVGRPVSTVLNINEPGVPSGGSTGLRLIEELAFFTGLGALMLFLAASALGRLSVRSVRDVRAARRREAEQQALEEQRKAREEEARQAAYQAGQRDQRDQATEIASGREQATQTPVTHTEAPPNNADDSTATTSTDPAR